MSEELDTGAPAGDPPSNEPQQPVVTQTPDSAPPSAPEFTIPDEYKERGWASKVKSVDDLWKQLDNSQQLIGRKYAAFDPTNATPNELEEYHSRLRPPDASEYNFQTSEDYEPSGMEPVFAEMLFNAGISKYQAAKLIPAFQAWEQSLAGEMFDKDAFLGVMEEKFGRGYEVKVNQTRQLIEGNLNDKAKEQLGKLPNDALSLVYELANNMAEAYGAYENGGQGSGPNGGIVTKSPKEEQAEIRQQLDKLTRNPYHTEEDKQRLIQQLTESKQREIAQRVKNNGKR